MAKPKKNTLTRFQRLVLANQYSILEALYPEQEFAEHRIIVESGFESEYHRLFGAIETGVNATICEEVVAILNLHRALATCIQDPDSAKSVANDEIKFDGFDGNNEFEHSHYAEYLFSKRGKYKDLIENDAPIDGNSHMPRLEYYRRLLEKWDELGKKMKLTPVQVREILDAGN